MQKKLLRQNILRERSKLSDDIYQSRSLLAQKQLCAQPCFSNAKTIALYSPIRNEVATRFLFEIAGKQGKTVFYPRVNGVSLDFIEVVSQAELVPGSFGVAEPSAQESVDPESFDLIVVPGLVFDLRGHRLGYGRGFYDRLLTGRSVRTVVVGLCFDFQVCQELPIEEHDQQLDFLITENRFIPCHNGVAGLI